MPLTINKNSEDMNEGIVLAPGEPLDAQGRILLDSAGAWNLALMG
jgi:hypothetical protein